VYPHKIKESWLSHLNISIHHYIALHHVTVFYITSFLREYTTQNPVPYLVSIVLHLHPTFKDKALSDGVTLLPRSTPIWSLSLWL